MNQVFQTTSGDSNTAGAFPHLCRLGGREKYPLSFSQRDMWVLCQIHPDIGLHNIAVEVVFTGQLDAEVLGRAFQAVVDRHESLRTAFASEDGMPYQFVQPVRVDLTLHDLTGLLDEEQRHRVRARSESLARAPFALGHAPLFKLELLRLSDRRSVLVFVFHNLILDGFHLPQLLKELVDNYDSALDGNTVVLPPLSLQFGDFAVWEERAFNQGAFAGHADHWRAQLCMPAPSMSVAADRGAPDRRTFEQQSRTVRLSSELSAAISQLSRDLDTTTFRLTAASFAVLLSRLTGEGDVLLAMPLSTRPPEMHDSAGFFGNTLPLRVAVNPEDSFERLVGDVTSVIRQARERREFPLTELMRTLEYRRDLNRPLMPICIAQVRPFEMAGRDILVTLESLFSGGTAFDLSLLVGGHERLELQLVYAGELFNEATIASFLDALVSLLAAGAADPRQSVRELEMLSPGTRTALQTWSDGGPSLCLSSAGIGAELADAADRAQDATAVITSSVAWTYADLHCAADRVTAVLRSAGIGREGRVGIIGARGAGMLAAVIGVLKAGAAFVPLDASLPDVRLRQAARDAALSVVLSDIATLSRTRTLASGLEHAMPVMCWDTLQSDQQLERPPVVVNGPADLAYIFYTSGSTGRPKGTMVEQRGLQNHLRAKIAALALDHNSVVAQNASYGFDIIVWQWLAALLVGGRVVIYDDPIAENPAGLLAAMERDGITVLETVPSFLDAMLECAQNDPGSRLPALRWMISNAEVLPPAVAARWMSRYPAARLMNAYGPTECSDDTMHADVDAEMMGNFARVPIGRPIPGSFVAVVDDLVRPVPPNCAGEIVIGGTAVGRGYLGEAALTARTFVPDTLTLNGGRLYRTGDRGRWRPDGLLECLGRVDDQIKLHGYRVELGEVDAALASVSGAVQAVAAVKVDARGQRRLVAYYAGANECDPGQLRGALAARLPAYMVPTAFVRVPALPRTRTGKLDRTSLPPPPVPVISDEPLADELEKIIGEVWRQVLKVPTVGRHDNFFDLGGDSIQSIRVVSRLNERRCLLSPRSVFAHQTIAELAHLIRSTQVDAAGTAGELGEDTPDVLHRGSQATRPEWGDEYPLAPIQEGMLFHAIAEPASSLYCEQSHFAFDGALDTDVFRRAWEHVIRRTPVLRSIIRSEGVPDPVQVVQPPMPLPLDIVDLAGLPADEQESRIVDLAEQDWNRKFALDCGPLFRLILFALGGDRWRFVFCFHHILLDGWSGTIVLREFASAYESILHGDDPQEADTHSFAAFVSWLQRQDRSQGIAFWKDRLARFDSPTPLPYDSIPGPIRRRATDQLESVIPADTARLLYSWARAQRVTMSSVVRAAWAVVLARISGVKDVVFGATVSGRPAALAGVENIVGPFINAVPVRAVVDETLSLSDFVSRIHAQSVDATDFEFLPLTEVHSTSAVAGNTPLFSTLVSYENFPTEERPRSIAGAPFRLLHSRELTHFDLTIYAIPSDSFTVRLTYATDVFARHSVERYVRCVVDFLKQLAAAPQSPIRDLPVVSAEDRKCLEAWGDGGSVSPRRRASVAADFAAVAAEVPDATAVTSEGVEWTYRRLAAEAGGVAGRLRALGVGREVCVGVMGTRSAGMLASVVGILKAGAAFVPLEGRYPDERLRRIVEAAQVRVILSDRATAERAARVGGAQVPIVCWDEAGAWERAGEERGSAGDLAYVFFTSGSTGTPKGVMVEQAALSNHLQAKIAALGLDASSVVVQTASYGFDIVVWQWLAALLVGGRVVIYDDATAEDPLALLPALARDGATVIETVPSFLEALLDVAEEAAVALPALRWMVSNAEALPAAVAARWRARYPHVRLLNTYGATECGDDVTHGEITESTNKAARAPVGRAIPGATVAVVDAEQRPVPPGCTGEIVVGGIAVGRGYLLDPVATARSFAPDARSDQPGSRVYCTGDLGRWTSAGMLECLGREDDQIKVRGFRVELGEIEAALVQLQGITQVAAAVRPDAQGRNRLVAYYVGAADHDSHALRKALLSRLASYMMPEAFVRVDSLPRTPTGKLDRSALPDPCADAGESEEPPSSPLESAIADVWREMLHVPYVGRHDNFFDLGGHSLSAIRIIAALKQRIGRRVAIRELFSAPSVAQLAATMSDAAPEHGLLLSPVKDRAWYPLSSAQRAQWIVQQMTTDDEWYSPRVVRLDGDLDREAFGHALQGLVARHDSLRTKFDERAGDMVQIVVDRYELPWRFEDLSELTDGERNARLREVLEEESKRPFDLAHLPRLEVRLLKVEAVRHLLIFRLPHIVTDGWTEGRLIVDLAELYSAYRSRRMPILPTLHLRHVDTCSREEEWLATPTLLLQKAYWLERFGGYVPELHLPRTPPTNRSQHRTGYVSAVLDAATVAAVRSLAADRSVTVFVTLLSAFKVLLRHLSGQADLVVGTPVAGRARPELQHIAGLFMNVLPLRTSLAGNPAFVEILERVGTTTVGGLINQDYPFQRWAETLPRAGKARLFSALFVLHEEVFRPDFDGLSARWFSAEAFGTSLFSESLPWYPGAIAFYGNDTGSGWNVTLVGDSSAYSRDALRHMLELWLSIVRTAVKNPHARIADLVAAHPVADDGLSYANVGLDSDEIDQLFA